MKLRTKSIIVICAGFSIFCIILSLILNQVITANYLDLETKTVSENVRRILNQFEQEYTNLGTIAADWAMWDDTYIFIKDKNEAYIENNLNYESLESLDINFMLFYDNSDTLVCSKVYDFQDKNETALPTSLYSFISNNSAGLLHLYKTQYSLASRSSGILFYDTNETPLIIGINTILNSNRDSPTRGSLIVGRYLDNLKINFFENITQLPIRLCPLTSQNQVIFHHATVLIEKNPVLIQPTNSTYVAGYVRLNDILGTPILVLEVGSNRDFYNQGINLIQNLIISLILTMIILIVIVIFVLDKFVTSRLTNLIKSVNDIKINGDLSTHLHTSGNDEISLLEKDIDSMLASLRNTWVMKDSAELSLQKKIEELERFKTITIDREIKMIELKKQLNELSTKFEEKN